jgi:hypothetical protein
MPLAVTSAPTFLAFFVGCDVGRYFGADIFGVFRWLRRHAERRNLQKTPKVQAWRLGN